MQLLNNILYLIATMRPMWGYALNFVFCIAFISSVPAIVRTIFQGR